VNKASQGITDMAVCERASLREVALRLLQSSPSSKSRARCLSLLLETGRSLPQLLLAAAQNGSSALATADGRVFTLENQLDHLSVCAQLACLALPLSVPVRAYDWCARRFRTPPRPFKSSAPLPVFALFCDDWRLLERAHFHVRASELAEDELRFLTLQVGAFVTTFDAEEEAWQRVARESGMTLFASEGLMLREGPRTAALSTMLGMLVANRWEKC
jgi:hypothetical protein